MMSKAWAQVETVIVGMSDVAIGRKNVQFKVVTLHRPREEHSISLCASLKIPCNNEGGEQFKQTCHSVRRQNTVPFLFAIN